MKMTVVGLEEQEYKGKDILRPVEMEIEISDVYLMHNSFKTISVGNGLIRLTTRSFKDLKKQLIKTKNYERIMVL